MVFWSPCTFRKCLYSMSEMEKKSNHSKLLKWMLLTCPHVGVGVKNSQLNESFLKACIFLRFMPSVCFLLLKKKKSITLFCNISQRKKLTWKSFCEIHQHLYMDNCCLRETEKTFLRTCRFLQLHERAFRHLI